MKLKNLFLAVIAAGAALVGCDPSEVIADAWEVGAESEITLNKEGGSQSFKVKSSADWNVRGLEDAAWLDVQVDGQSITGRQDVIKGSGEEHEVAVSALPNTGKNRTATITIFASVKNQIAVKVTQLGELGDGVITTTVADLIANPIKGQEYRLSGSISSVKAGQDKNGKDYAGFNLTDATGMIYVYSLTDATVAEYKDKLVNGATATVVGAYDYYEKNQQHEIVNAVIEAYEAPETVDPDDAVDATVAEFIEKADAVNYYRLSGTVSNYVDGTTSAGKKYIDFDLTDATGTILIYGITDESIAAWDGKIKNGYKVTLRGRYQWYEKDQKHEVVDAIIDTVEEVEAEKIEVTGLVLAISKYGFLVQTAEGIAYVYDKDIEVKTVKVGDNVTVNGEKTVYQDIDEIENYTVTVNSSDNELPEVEATELDAAAFDEYESPLFGLVKFTGKLTKSTSGSNTYYNVAVKDATRKGSLSNPIDVDEELLTKWVDVTGYFVGISGTSTKYLNVIVTALALSEDQPANEEPEGATVGEDEVGYELTNAEIVAAFAASTQTKDTYDTFKIESASGEWTGNMNTKKGLTYIQLRNKTASHLKSPTFEKNIKRIALRINGSTIERTLYAVPASTQVPTATSAYAASLWATNYGSVSRTIRSEAETLVITFNAEAKDFTLIASDGAVYIDSILVICEK